MENRHVINGFNFIEITDNDPFNYCPIKDGIGPSSASIPKLGRNSSLSVIESDSYLFPYLLNKKEAREQWDKGMFYQVLPELPEKHIKVATTTLLDLINASNHAHGVDISHDLSPSELFDSICMQIQEDVVLMTVIDGKPVASMIHVHLPNGWSADGEIGKDFETTHADVSHRNGKLVIPNGNKMIANIVKRPCQLERIGAISFRANAILNRHPEIPLTPEFSQFNPDAPKLYMRFERQTITTIPEIDSFIFTIKTYMYDVFKPGREAHMINVFKNIHTDAYSRWWLDENADIVVSCLEKQLGVKNA